MGQRKGYDFAAAVGLRPPNVAMTNLANIHTASKCKEFDTGR